jgi:hypothetical protein
MTRTSGSLRLILAIVALLALIAVIALPALAADPSGSPVPASEPAPGPDATDGDGATTAEEPPRPVDPGNPGKPPKAAKEKGEPVTVSGTVGRRTDAEGQVEYTLTDGATVVILNAGPPWYLGDDHPLSGSIGKRVTIVGTQRAGEAEVEVETVDGQAIREPGKPPWAGGWKVVGERHPGWSEEKAARWAERRAAQAERHGTDCWPPGQCKDGAATPAPGGN